MQNPAFRKFLSVKKFLIVTGCPRSGTTLLMKILNSHRQFCIGNEIDILSMYKVVAPKIKSKYEKSLRLQREFSDREKHLGNANYDYIPNPSDAIPRVLESFASSSKPESHGFEYLGDKYPRVYRQKAVSYLHSLASRVLQI